jgi:ABC-type multidrug transport system fused ATPase/permease subunit
LCVLAGRARRLATVRKVDRIVVLDALMAEGGLYARLAALQFRDAVGV